MLPLCVHPSALNKPLLNHLINSWDFIIRFISCSHRDASLKVHTCAEVRRAHCQVAQVSICCESHLFKSLCKLDQASQGVFHIIWHANSRQHYDLNVVLKVHEYDKFKSVLYEYAPPHRIIIIDSCRIVQGCSLNIDSNLCQPLFLSFFDSGDLVILTAKFTKDFNDTPFDL